jgi:Holliday junction resolvase RusA-like endonuclease
MTQLPPSNRIEFFVDTRPIAKQSFRMGRGGGYQPKRVTDFKKYAQVLAIAAAKEQGWEKTGKPLSMDVTFVFRQPKNTKVNDRIVAKWRTCRPDLDNLEKAITDALCDLMDDDAQICMKTSRKITGSEDDQEGIWVRLAIMDEMTGVGRSNKTVRYRGDHERSL